MGSKKSGIFDRTVVITGAGSGIGRAAAAKLASIGARVALVCRRRENGEEALEAVRSVSAGKPPELFLADLSIQREVRELAGRICRRFSKLHVLINNAGTMRDGLVLTEEGFELMFAVNYLAPFLLTRMLLPNLISGSPSRVINVTAALYDHSPPIWGGVNGLDGFSAQVSYSRSKLALAGFTRELARRVGSAGLTVNCVNPGMTATGIAERGPRILRDFYRESMEKLQTPEEGAQPVVFLATSPKIEWANGAIFFRDGICDAPPAVRDEKECGILWKTTEELTGMRYVPEKKSWRSWLFPARRSGSERR